MNDAGWTATYAGDSEPGPRQGDRRYLDAFVKAVAEHGATSREASRAVTEAIEHGWSPSGITEALIDGGKVSGRLPSDGDRRGTRDRRRTTTRPAGDRRGGGGIPGPKSPPVDQ